MTDTLKKAIKELEQAIDRKDSDDFRARIAAVLDCLNTKGANATYLNDIYYENFLTKEILYNNFIFDNYPVEGSDNAVFSGGVYECYYILDILLEYIIGKVEEGQ